MRQDAFACVGRPHNHNIGGLGVGGGPLSLSGLENEAYLQGGSIMGHIIDNISYDHIHYANTQLV